MLQTLAAESLLQNRALQWTSHVVTLTGLALLALLMLFSWRRLSAGKRVALLAATAVAVEAGAFALQAAFPLILDTSLFQIAIIVYIAAIALDEIDIRDLLGRVAESRFQRVAMSLGDGLICTDSNYLITVWNPGATAIFGYLPEEMIGRPFDEICARDEAVPTSAFSIKNAADLAAGSVVEFDGRRSNGEVFPVEASFSGWQGTDGFQFGAILRDISVRKREAERIRYLAEHDTLTGPHQPQHPSRPTRGEDCHEPKLNGRKVALLVIGIDGFQQINDMLGTPAAISCFAPFRERLTAAIPPAGLVARLSGDEFAIAVPTSDIGENVSRFAEQIGDGFDAPLLAGNRHLRVRVSIGAAIFPERRTNGGRTSEQRPSWR